MHVTCTRQILLCWGKKKKKKSIILKPIQMDGLLQEIAWEKTRQMRPTFVQQSCEHTLHYAQRVLSHASRCRLSRANLFWTLQKTGDSAKKKKKRKRPKKWPQAENFLARKHDTL